MGRNKARFDADDHAHERVGDIGNRPGLRGPQDEPVTSHDGSGNGAPALTPERLNALRQWIQAGLYDSPEVLAVVARRLHASGEV